MTAQQLKNSILQLAVQGKLVPQDPTDEPASVLLERIRAEKEKLIKEGKIKKEKNPSVIFRGADNTPYEKIGNAEPVSIADEVPFDIPDSWEWVRIKTISSVVTKGTTPRGGNVSYLDSGVGFLRAENVAGFDCLDKSNLNFIDENTHNNYLKRSILQENDILVTIAGTLGRTALVRNEDLPLNANQAVSIIRVIDKYQTDLLFLILALNSPTIQKSLTTQKKITAIPNLTLEIISDCIIPIPPKNEQNRIVSEFFKYIPLINEYESKYASLDVLNKSFPESLKKSILQMAVQGKLVHQDENDEPASVLLERIRAEKQRLIAEGKIKKDKNESVIFRRDNSHYEKVGSTETVIEDEIPFEIPESWEWIRMGSLLQVNPRNTLNNELDVGFIPMPLLEGGFSNSHTFEMRKWSSVKSGFTHFADNDVVIAKITPCFQNRKSAVIKNLPNGYGAGTTELHVLRDNTKLLYMPYILLICKTNDFIINGVANFSGTAGQQRVGKDYISSYLVPLPPYNEQIRIVDTTWELINSVSTLE